MASKTRSRSPERAIGLASQFNFIFAELSSAAKRPASLTVGVSGPFDPIEIPDDVKAVHAALASKQDSVPVKGGGGGSGGAAAGAPRGRTQDKAAPAQRPASLAPGDSTGVACYARFVALLGPKMENLVACAGLINKYFKDTVGQDALLSDHGVVRVPLVLASNFAWKAMTNKFKNHNARRDIYAAWCVLRDRCSGKGRGLTAYGKEYKVSHPTWENLAADEFAALYTPAPASAKTKFTLGTFVIRGVTVTEFSA